MNIIDTREPKELAEYLNFERKMLKCGDIVTEHFIIERKTLVDLYSSIMDKRIYKQIANMSKYSREPILILEFIGYENLDIAKKKIVFGFLRNHNEIRIVLSYGIEHTAYQIKKLEENYGRPIIDKSFNKSMISLTLFEKILTLCKFVSYEKAIEIAEHYRNINEILKADYKDFSKNIKGFGKQKYISLISTLTIIKSFSK